MTKQQCRRAFYAAIGIHQGTDSLTRFVAAERFEHYWATIPKPRKRAPRGPVSA